MDSHFPDDIVRLGLVRIIDESVAHAFPPSWFELTR